MDTSIIVSSSLCRDEYPNNNGCEFTNQLNRPLDLSKGKWGVAVSEIIYENNFWDSIRPPFDFIDVEIENHQCRKITNFGLNFKVFEYQLVKRPLTLDEQVN